MTNTKFRKRALLSSVAMLLVAMLALGSATFAWFVGNPTVSSSGLKMQATAGSGLQIATAYDLKDAANADDEAALYDYTAAFSNGTDDFNLKPASPAANADDITGNTLVFATGQGSYSYDGTLSGTLTTSGVTPYTFDALATGDSVFYEEIYLRSSTADTLTLKAAAVSWTPVDNGVSNDIAKGIKIALVAPTGLIGIWKADSTAATTTQVFDGTSGLVAFTAGYTNNGATVKDLSYTVNNYTPSSTGGTAFKVRMYVYLDGEYSAVISDNAITAKSLFTDITVKFSTTNDDISFS